MLKRANYPHQSVVYHSMYRAKRDHPSLNTTSSALWYLAQAAKTVAAAWSPHGALWYMQQGLMAGSVWKDLLADLDIEGMVNSTSWMATNARWVRRWWRRGNYFISSPT